jgi:hypothetical protein
MLDRVSVSVALATIMAVLGKLALLYRDAHESWFQGNKNEDEEARSGEILLEQVAGRIASNAAPTRGQRLLHMHDIAPLRVAVVSMQQR